MAARNINVNLWARTEGFVKGMNKAKASYQAFQRVLGAVVSVAAARKLVTTITDAALAIDNLATRGERVGIAAREMATLEHATNMMDVSASALATSLIRMNKSIGEAMLGAKAQSDAFRRLRIDINELQNLKPDQQFLMIASALSNVGNQAMRTKLGMDIFGRGAAELGPIFNKSASEIRKFIEEGNAFSSSLTDNTLNAAFAVDQAQKRMSASWKNLTDSLVGIYGPAIAAAMESLTPSGAADTLQAIPMREFVESQREELSQRLSTARATMLKISSDDDLYGRLERSVPIIIERLAELDRMLANIDRKAGNQKFSDTFGGIIGDEALKGGFRDMIRLSRGAFDSVSRQAELAAHRLETSMKRMRDSVIAANEAAAKDIREMLMEPADILEQFRREMSGLVGVEGGITQNEFERALVKRAKELGLLQTQLDQPSSDLQSPSAMLRGSQDEFSARVQATQDKVQDQIRKELEEQTKVAKKTETHASDMVRVMKLIEEHNRDIAVAN